MIGTFESVDLTVCTDLSAEQFRCVCPDPWWIIGFHFVVALNNILVLGYPYLILVPLGWYVGTSLWIVGMVLAYYCNTLLAAIHEYGGVRHIRHRDLAHHIYGDQSQTLFSIAPWTHHACDRCSTFQLLAHLAAMPHHILWS